ncbi:HEAT repeat domain-containing protein [Candidatus Micrarchaeota archaeon]|nr:HEAT repeat domain-containing protein [Candidatus Micrarchaeota archaeon]
MKQKAKAGKSQEPEKKSFFGRLITNSQDRRTRKKLLRMAGSSLLFKEGKAKKIIKEIKDCGPEETKKMIDETAKMMLKRKENADIITNCAYILGEFGDEGAIDSLMEALYDEDVDVRIAVAGALKKISIPESIKKLNEDLNDPNPEIRIMAVEALGLLGEETSDALINALNNDNERVRTGAAGVLVLVGREKTREKLGKKLNEESLDEGLKYALNWIVENIENKLNIEAEEMKSQELQEKIAGLIAQLDDDNYQKGRDAVEELVKIGKPAVAPLINLLGKTDVDDYIAEILWRIGDNETMAHLFQFLKSTEDGGFQKAGMGAIANIARKNKTGEGKIQIRFKIKKDVSDGREN